MATSGTQKVLAGTRSVRYPDPKIKGTANQFGLYQWSAFDALLVEGFKVSGDVEAYSGAIGAATLDVLVFTSDIPAISRGIVRATTLQFSRPARNVLSCSAAVSTLGGATAASIAQYGQVLTGYTGVDSDVLVTGFPLSLYIQLPGTEEEADDVYLQVLANSPVINGVVGPLYGNTSAAPSPIILEASLYTQAIKENGNIYQLNATASQYQVVGIYAVIPD